QTHNSDDVYADFARRFNHLYGRRSCGTHIIHNDDLRPFFLESLDALPGAMLFLRLAHQKTANFATHHCDGAHNRVRSHGEPTNRAWLPPMGLALIPEFQSGQSSVRSIEGRDTSVHFAR